MRTRISSIFYKTLVIFILLGMLPALLMGARLLTLNQDFLRAGGEGWTLSQTVVQEITDSLTLQAGFILLVTFLVTSLSAILISRGLAGPIKQLQQYVNRIGKGEIEQNPDIHTGDEIEDLATSFTKIARKLVSQQQNLEVRISERARDLERRAVQLQLAGQIARDAASTHELSELVNRAVNLIWERFDFYHVNIFLLDDKSEYAVLRASSGEAGRVQLERGYKLKIGEVGIVSYVANTGELRLVNDVEVDYVYQRHPLLPDTRSEIAVPLKVGTKVIGVLDVHSSQIDAFDEYDVASLQILADQLAVAIQNTRLVSELEGRLREINTLNQQYTRESWSRRVSGEQLTGYQYDLSTLSPMIQSLPPHILAKLRGGRIIALQGDESLVRASDQPALVAPLVMYDQLIGAIGISQDDPNHQWSQEEIALMEAVSNQVALALDNARLLEETQLRSEQLRLLQEITAAAASHLKLDELLDNIARKMQSGFDLPHCSIVMSDPGGNTGTVVANASQDPNAEGAMVVGMKIPLEGNQATEEVINTHKSMVFYDVQNNPKTASMLEFLRLRETSTLVIIPLMSRGETIGTIGFYIADAKRRFSPHDLQLLDQISLQITSAVDVARNFEQAALRAEREKVLAGIGTRMRETLDVQTVVQTAVNEIYRTLDLNEVALYLLPADDRQEKSAGN